MIFARIAREGQNFIKNIVKKLKEIVILIITFIYDTIFCNKTDYQILNPNDNTATIWLKVEDLIEIIKEHGNKVNIEEF